MAMTCQILTAAVLLISVVLYATAQVPIPTKPLGFVYKNGSHSAAVHIDVFIDLACPDSKSAFPVLQQVADMYGQSVRLKFFVFPLPYHRNAHFSAIATQVVFNKPTGGRSPDDAAIAWCQLCFAHQIKWSDSVTANMNYDQIRTLIASYSTSLGYDASSFKQMMMDSNNDWNARVEWKFGCSKGVAGTPWFFINGVYFGADGSWTVSQWKKAIDSLLNGRHL